MKRLFILALMPIMAPFTALAMNPSFQGQNNEIPVITSYLENTDPRIQPNQHIGNPIYATLVPGVMPALNNNHQITDFYLPNNISQPIEPAQFQAYQNQVQFNPMQNLLMAIPVHVQNQPYASLETTNISQNQSKKRSANYPQQNKRHKISPQANIPNINSPKHNPEQKKPPVIVFYKNTYENIKNRANNKTSHTSKLFKNLKPTDLNPISLRLFLEKIYKNTFENDKLFEVKDELFQKLISYNDIDQTKKNIKQLLWTINCPIEECQHATHMTIDNKFSSTFYFNLKNHINNIHAGNSNLKEIIDEIKQQKINLVRKKEQPPVILTQKLQSKDNNIPSIKKHLEQFYQYVFKNNQLCEIKNELLQRLISDNGIEETKQNIKQLIWIIDCPEDSCQQIIYASINNKHLYGNLNGHIKNKHANSKEIIDKIKQQQVNLVFHKKTLNKLNQNNDPQIPNSNNIGMFSFKNNLPPEFIDQKPKYDNYPQLGLPDHYSDNLNIIEPESFFDDQNKILAFDDFQDSIFNPFTTNQ